MSESFYNANIILYPGSKNRLHYENQLFSLTLHYVAYTKRSNTPFHQKRLHCHPFYELQIVLNGKSEYAFDKGLTLSLDSGQFMLFPPEVKHYIFYESPDFEKLYFEFDFKTKDSENGNVFADYEKVMRIAKAYNINNELKKELEKIHNFPEEKSQEMTIKIFFSFLNIFMEIFSIVSSNNNFVAEPIHNDIRINEAINYINANISAKTSVKTVADQVHLSPKQLTRIFERVIGTTPGNYIQNCRLKKIHQLLGNPDLSLKEIADIMEYSDVSAMTRAFKRLEDNTPNRCRNGIFYS